MELRVPISLFILTMLLTFSDFSAFGLFAYGGATGLVSVVVETSVRAFLVFGLFVLVLKAYKVPNLRKRGWLKYALVTMAIGGVPPMTLSVYLENYVLFHVLSQGPLALLSVVSQGLLTLVSDLPVVLGFLFAPLEAFTLEFPRLLLTQRIWQMLLKPDRNQVGRQTEKSNESLANERSEVCSYRTPTLSATQRDLFQPFQTFSVHSRPFWTFSVHFDTQPEPFLKPVVGKQKEEDWTEKDLGGIDFRSGNHP